MGKKEQGSALPRGITVRRHQTGETLQLTFTYKGVLCREPLSGLEVNPRNIKYADRLLGEIQNKISLGTFAYGDYFPKSRKLATFGEVKKTKTVREYLNEYITICINRKLSPSTIDGYQKCITSLSTLHALPVTELTAGVLKTWISNKNAKLKTIRNLLSFLRSALDEAVTDGLIELNPVSLVTASRYRPKQTTEEKDDYVVDPFTPQEAKAIFAACTYEQWRYLFQFAMHTGLRSSELCALRWQDVDLVHNTIHVQKASVIGVIKGTKTAAGTRKVELDEMALSALAGMRSHTFMRSEYVFEDPKTMEPWSGSAAIRKKAWMPALRRAQVRYRNPYQTRHTYATRHISIGVNLYWLCGQMGHKGPEMLFRHYGSYLKDYDGNTSKQPNHLAVVRGNQAAK